MLLEQIWAGRLRLIWSVPKFDEVMLSNPTTGPSSRPTRPLSLSSFYKLLPYNNLRNEHNTDKRLYKVYPNAMHKLGGEVKNIMRSLNYEGKHGRKVIGSTVRELTRSEQVISSFQTWTTCDEHVSLYERRVGRYPLHLPGG
ncbi:hypothetical protein TNCV_2817331 [Trichonephila clavipes]|nr:hypothetical protein TNCV_2817331 [Trichonephila clavipes]